jgi:hypothetical protein
MKILRQKDIICNLVMNFIILNSRYNKYKIYIKYRMKIYLNIFYIDFIYMYIFIVLGLLSLIAISSYFAFKDDNK